MNEIPEGIKCRLRKDKRGGVDDGPKCQLWIFEGKTGINHRVAESLNPVFFALSITTFSLLWNDSVVNGKPGHSTHGLSGNSSKPDHTVDNRWDIEAVHFRVLKSTIYIQWRLYYWVSSTCLLPQVCTVAWTLHTFLWTTGITKAIMLTHSFEFLNILPLCKQATVDFVNKQLSICFENNVIVIELIFKLINNICMLLCHS